MRDQAWRFELRSYDFQHQLVPRYSDLDTWRHVNNVAVYQMHLEARVRHQMSLLGVDSWYSDTVLLRPRRVVVNFLRETHYPDPVSYGVRVLSVDDQSYRLAVGLFQNGACVGVQDCTMTAWQDGKQVPLPNEVRAAFAAAVSVGEAVPAVTADDVVAAAPEAYPTRAELMPRYSDQDPDRQTAEAALARYMEQARASIMTALDLSDLGVLIASAEIAFNSYRRPHQQVVLAAGIGRMGNSSFDLHTIAAADGDWLAAAKSVMVLMDRETGRPGPMPPSLREQMQSRQLRDVVG